MFKKRLFYAFNDFKRQWAVTIYNKLFDMNSFSWEFWNGYLEKGDRIGIKLKLEYYII